MNQLRWRFWGRRNHHEAELRKAQEHPRKRIAQARVGTLNAAGCFRGLATVLQGLNFIVGDVMTPTGFLSSPTVQLMSIDLTQIILELRGVRQPNAKLPINIDGTEIVVVDEIGSNGLDKVSRKF
ncbi:Cytochrome c biogenesis protein CCS1 [Spatholobus suberectus]|nr:Cytochrome c biogenesis protein CCS1 [Spatholobus suberectus]